jgi:hypothetical protein
VTQPPTTPPPPPPPPAGGPAPTYGARPANVTAAGVILITVGALRDLLAVIAAIAIIGLSGEIAGLEGGGAVIGIAVFFLLLSAAVGVVQIIGGTNVLRLRKIGRVLGIVGCAVGAIIVLMGLLGGGATGLGLGIAVLLLLGDIVGLVLVAQLGQHLTLP